MGRWQHQTFERKPRDFYPTPIEAAMPLKPHLPKEFEFIEPCAGNGILVEHLESFGGKCISATDIEPQVDTIKEANAFEIEHDGLVITNPPWDRKILHPMIEHFTKSDEGCWLLFDAAWMHTKQSEPYMKWCRKIVSIGRVKWIPDTGMVGKDDSCWYYFNRYGNGTEFFGRKQYGQLDLYT